MTIKLRHLPRWSEIRSGDGLKLPGERRVVELELNVSAQTHVAVLHGKASTFLGVVQPGGPVKVQFSVEGDCTLIPTSDGEVWYFTDDGDVLNFGTETESFTELEQRMDMSQEMEITILKANLRHEQRQREVAELLLKKKQREEAAAANANPETGEVDDEAEKPADDNSGKAGSGKVAGNSPASEPKP